ncbi:MAG: xanthine dehydrogenase family protein molybdopterin-binding subunit [Propionibacteriaceae bacterium]|jgi:CO/xanthine dehydrogenase Mo-binding subunit|nr:xanthine dehydrogenase family protein molybdopterin-binding subunit [Propionibacteriaceae bacterium]
MLKTDIGEGLHSQPVGDRKADGYVGTSVPRYGGLDRASGAQKYIADFNFADVLEAALVYVPVGRAEIESIDASEALAMPGVERVITAADLPDPMPWFGVNFKDRPVMVAKKVNYYGEPVALVLAEDADTARAAAKRVRVAYREIPGVYNREQAIAEGAPLAQDASDPRVRPNDPLRESNVIEKQLVTWGDVAEQEAKADLIVEGTYTYPMMTHFTIEPLGLVAEPTDDGGLTLHLPVQHPYLLQHMIAGLVKLPLSKVRILAPDPGGGFGGKQIAKYSPLMSFAALLTGRTVRFMYTLEETFLAIRRAGSWAHVRTGFSKAGDILFQDIQIDYVLGAYADVAPRVMTKGSYVGAGPYHTPAARIDARALLTNTTVSTAMRAYGVPQVSWSCESQINEGARQLGLDPAEVRRRNLAARDEAFIGGSHPSVSDGDWRQVLDKALELSDWNAPLGPNCGKGLAMAVKPSATTGLSQSLVRLLYDGSAMVYAGTSDMGQGARTIWSQAAADELGIPIDKVTVVSGDTDQVPFDLQTSASRSSVFMGDAVVRACRDLRGRVLAMYAEVTGADPEQLSHEPGKLITPDGELPLEEAARKALGSLRGEFIGQGTTRMTGVKGHPLGGPASFFELNCTVMKVEVDPETGYYKVLQHIVVGDAGIELNPVQIAAQDEGAAVMGIGQSAMEQYIFDEHGVLRNAGALDYRIPTFMDIADDFRSANVENLDGPGPYGAKGVSESGLLVTSAALGAAIQDATGVQVRDLPITYERLWAEINRSKTTV